jgi:predicted nucleotidyltransferase component of viral defense system
MSISAASIRAKLQQIAKKDGIAFQVIIFRFLHERFLYRLSNSPYKNQFFLKGGALLYSVEETKTRPTKDLDFLAQSIQNELVEIKKALEKICDLPYSEDAVWFDSSSVESERITEQDKYEGVRIYLECGFDTIRQKLQIDIGFGDVMVPAPQEITYPILLPTLEIPLVQAYSIETVIAEKFQAMIELSSANSRMKDFYDVYQILMKGNYNPDTLGEAIRGTFRNRKTNYQPNHALFNGEIGQSPVFQNAWGNFLKKTKVEAPVDFSEVLVFITSSLQEIWNGFINCDFPK